MMQYWMVTFFIVGLYGKPNDEAQQWEEWRFWPADPAQEADNRMKNQQNGNSVWHRVDDGEIRTWYHCKTPDSEFSGIEVK